MAALEEEGLIAQPHTSAGRIPTDKGYRYFVDMLADRGAAGQHKRAISTFLSDAVDLNDVVERSVRLLSQLTRQVAVVQYPSLRESPVRRVELVRMTSERALAVVVSADARVEQATVSVPAEVSEDEFERLAREVNETAAGLTPPPLESALAGLGRAPREPVPWLRGVGIVGGRARPAAAPSSASCSAGTGNLTRAGSDLEGRRRRPRFWMRLRNRWCSCGCCTK